MESKMNNAIELSLKTWYPKDHPLHLDPLHPALGLAGEAGELLNLYKKERFKDGVSWWDCARCGHSQDGHNNGECTLSIYPIGLCPCESYTPKILDELGDAWYYLRILAYQSQCEFVTYLNKDNQQDNILDVLISINTFSGKILTMVSHGEKINTFLLNSVFNFYLNALLLLDFTLDQATESNWAKLSARGNNGWGATLKTAQKK